MTSTLSQQFFDTFPPEVARGILEGDRLRIHAAKVSVILEADGTTGFAIDAPNRDGRPAEWEKMTRKICRILKHEIARLQPETKHLLAALAHITPGEPLLLFQVETWLSMQDDGGSWREVPAFLSRIAISLPDVVVAAKRTKKKVLKEVCKP